MKILVFGTGGVGGYFGGRLAASGAQVIFIARGEHLKAMQMSGLRILSGLGDAEIRPIDATDDVNSVGTVDLAMVSVKLWDTQAAARAIESVVGPQTAIVSFQNGIEAVDIMIKAYGRKRVIGGTAHIAAVIERPGVIRHNGTLQRLTFGELDGRFSARTQALYGACQKAGIEVSVSSDVQKLIWEKFVFIVGLSGMTALTRLPIGPVRQDPVTRTLLFDVMREAAAVGRAKGVTLDADTAKNQLAFMDERPDDMIASMLGDLQRGHRLELPWLSGAVVRLGDELGVATPANRFICAALKLHAEGSLANAGNASAP
jgi:2-dehydropantoate 2-reductase